jgi:hypothetical protein
LPETSWKTRRLFGKWRFRERWGNARTGTKIMPNFARDPTMAAGRASRMYRAILETDAGQRNLRGGKAKKPRHLKSIT